MRRAAGIDPAEGLILLALIALFFVIVRLQRGMGRREIVWGLAGVVGCLALLAPYAAFNLRVAGFIFPTTFYAKQAEYRTMIEQISLPVRFGRLLLAVWVGPQILLAPGFLFSVISSLRWRQTQWTRCPLHKSSGQDVHCTNPVDKMSTAQTQWTRCPLHKSNGQDVHCTNPVDKMSTARQEVHCTARGPLHDMTLLWVWWLCAIAVYALRLPVTYQHGRYLIPTIPVFVILGVWGTWEVARSLEITRVGRVLGRTWMVSLVVLLLLFWVLGAQAYTRDVHFIYGEMGTMAAWLDENVSPQSRLAVHDIGMVGYYLRRPFLDLAGLVTPEVIPFIDDEGRLLDFMHSQDIEYVVVFPDWSDAYRRMVRDPRLSLVYSTHYTWTLSAGQENLSVYRADWSISE